MDKYSAIMKKGDSKLLIRNLRKMKEQEQQKQALDLSNVSQRSELLKAEDPERSFDEYLEKYFSEPKIELVYKTLHDGKERTEKEIIRMYKQAHRL